ncbi:lipopolysaccharide heptosyltransferase II [bacterium]|nr:lipopolysaccharide heptosyltransferase II [bacterium]
MKILVVCPNWVGDAVMATPTLRALRGRFPEAEIVGLMSTTIADTLAGNPWLDRTLSLPDSPRLAGRRWLAVIGQLRHERFDVAILFPNSFLSALVCRAGRVKRVVGYARDGRGLLLHDRLWAPWSLRGFRPTPLIDYYLRLLEPWGVTGARRSMELFLSTVDIARRDRLYQKFGMTDHRPLVTIHPGAAFGPAKHWPTESFAELARRLVDERQAHVIILCGPAERELARAIELASERSRSVHSLAHEDVSIGLSKAIVAQSHLLVSTDSGPRHFGPAFGIPVVSLFGPTRIEWTETYSIDEIHLQKVVPCGPCQKRVCPQGHHRCMRELSVDEVYRAVLMQLGDRPSRGASRVA